MDPSAAKTAFDKAMGYSCYMDIDTSDDDNERESPIIIHYPGMTFFQWMTVMGLNVPWRRCTQKPCPWIMILKALIRQLNI
jgi:hypothetical protein